MLFTVFGKIFAVSFTNNSQTYCLNWSISKKLVHFSSTVLPTGKEHTHIQYIYIYIYIHTYIIYIYILYILYIYFLSSQIAIASRVTSVAKFLRTKVTWTDMSSTFVLTKQAEPGNAAIVLKHSSILAIYGDTCVHIRVSKQKNILLT